MTRTTLFAGAFLAAAAAAGSAYALPVAPGTAAAAIPDRSVAIYDDGQGDGDQALGFVFSLAGDDLSIAADIFGGDLPGATDGLGPVDSIAADLFFDASGAIDGAVSQFLVFGPEESLLTGAGLDAEFEADRVRILFSIDGGSLSGVFGPFALMTLSGFGFDASAGPSAFLGDFADIEINPAALATPIPVPAALPLLVGGLAALGAARLRRAR